MRSKKIGRRTRNGVARPFLLITNGSSQNMSKKRRIDMKLISIESKPRKCNTSFGKWAVGYTFTWTGKNRISQSEFFWYKKDAMNFIEEKNKTMEI